MNKTNKLYAVLICIMLLISNTNVYATQSKTEYFSKTYTLTGNYADDIVAVAKAQEGRTQAQMGYTEAWCANFVSDCAKLAGISSLIPASGLVENLYNQLINAGGTVVNTPQKGDIVFYYCNACTSKWKHAGIMVNNLSSIDGNYSGKVTLHPTSQYSDGSHKVSTGQVTCVYVRPAYGKQPTVSESMGTYIVATDIGSRLNIRSQASTSGSIVGTLNSGDRIEVLDISNGWGYICNAGIYGWVSLSYCTKVDNNTEIDKNDVINVSYQTHVEDIGWQTTVRNGEISGTSGQGKRLEAIRIKLDKNGSDIAGGIQYSTHIQDIGWQSYKSDWDLSGTTGKAKRLEAIKIKLTGELAEKYDIYYRVHCQEFGWLGWAKNDEESGTAGYCKRLEAIEIKVVTKGTQIVTDGLSYMNSADDPNVNYCTHVEDIGWQSYVSNGNISGTTGLAKRLEGIKINLTNMKYSGEIEYSTHVQDIGWQSYVSNDSLSGTTGQAKRLEAIKINLTGNLAKYYDVYYRVHAECYGWLDWAKNGESAGTAGLAKRLEAIQIKIVRKGDLAPGYTTHSFIQK